VLPEPAADPQFEVAQAVQEVDPGLPPSGEVRRVEPVAAAAGDHEALAPVVRRVVHGPVDEQHRVLPGRVQHRFDRPVIRQLDLPGPERKSFRHFPNLAM